MQTCILITIYAKKILVIFMYDAAIRMNLYFENIQKKATMENLITKHTSVCFLMV